MPLPFLVSPLLSQVNFFGESLSRGILPRPIGISRMCGFSTGFGVNGTRQRITGIEHSVGRMDLRFDQRAVANKIVHDVRNVTVNDSGELA